MRGLANVLLILLPLALTAGAWPVQAVPDATPGEDQPVPDRVVVVYDWIRILPAPEGEAPAFGWPLRGPLTQPFGCTEFELERPAADCPGGFHTGIDLGLPQGTPIHASAGGLAYAFQDDLRYGNHVIVQHPGGYSTVYGHMVRTNVGWGQPVAGGDVIGFVGSTGNSTGPHLHFEIRFAGAPQDPMPYLDAAAPLPPPLRLPQGWPGSAPEELLGRR